MKMKVIFSMLPRLLLITPAFWLAGCSSSTRAQATPPGLDGGDAQRLVSLLDYVGGDYGRSVQDGAVLNPFEYEEQLRFLADARSMAAQLVSNRLVTGSSSLLARLDQITSKVRDKAPAAEVTLACREARDEAVARFGLRTMPTERPELARAQALFTQSCVPCHGERGDARTERARTLDPPPADFREPARLAGLSPYRVYNALTFGVTGTGMASFEVLAPADRWSLAFYVLRLAHEGEPMSSSASMPLADLALRSDREILESLSAQPWPRATLVALRREAAFAELPTGVGVDRTRRLLTQAVESFDAGSGQDAERFVIDAYLQGFEPLEPRLNARDAQATLQVEAGFRDLRAALAQGDKSAVRATTAALDRRIAEVTGEPRRAVPFAAAFLIYFREGIEAALLVAALLAGLTKLGRKDAAKFIHAGWMLAVPAGVITWWVLDRVLQASSLSRELLEALVALAAAVVLFSVSFWLISRAESRHWMAYLKDNLARTLSHRNLMLLASVSFLAVYREAAETVLFTQALLLEAGSESRLVWLGALCGTLAVLAVAFLMNRTVHRLPLAPFFAVSGVLLSLLAISFAGSGLYTLVAAGYLAPRPVSFPEVAWLGVHPDLTSLIVQLAIILVVAAAGLQAFRRASTNSESA